MELYELCALTLNIAGKIKITTKKKIINKKNKLQAITE